MATRRAGRRGFAAMSREERTRISRMGGQASRGRRGNSRNNQDDFEEENDDFEARLPRGL